MFKKTVQGLLGNFGYRLVSLRSATQHGLLPSGTNRRGDSEALPALTPIPAAQGQRTLNPFQRQDFGEEVRIHHAGKHLAAQTVLARMTL